MIKVILAISVAIVSETEEENELIPLKSVYSIISLFLR